MPRGDLRPLDRLLRYRDFKVARAELDLQSTAVSVRLALQQEHLARQRLHGLAQWKARQDANGGLQLAHYQQALAMEQQAVRVLDESCQAVQEAKRAHASARDAWELAHNQAEVVQQRRQRLASAVAAAQAHRQTDAAADLWLARSANARA